MGGREQRDRQTDRHTDRQTHTHTHRSGGGGLPIKSSRGSEDTIKHKLSNFDPTALSLTVAMTLKIATNIFHTISQLMMVYHHTEFGYKRCSSSEDVV